VKILQIVYPGLGGSATVAFSLVEGQNRENKYKNCFLFYGIENLLKAHVIKCKKQSINYFFEKKKKIGLNSLKLLSHCKKISPDVIIVHDIYTIPFYIYGTFKKKKIIFVHHSPDKTKKIYDWIKYLINGIFCNDIVLVSKRSKNDFMYKLNKFFFNNKVKIILNGIDTSKFSK